MARVWTSIDERVEAYDEVVKCMKENNITLDEAFERKGFAPEDRLDENALLVFSVQSRMRGEFLPG